ncbi:HAD family hydrolase [Halodesulfurarchaeum formicicum]|uniref:HAD-superfamily hydrolase n=1 Tax=Halodesulfurarchaeum formicicum TaxID=1873524 RepID=A0A1J1ACH6_9EURY|nr:HAD hydrolase-like protein [Halodesulfurarchaeum formicicum]APE95289.1 HAD-superfamily hydrolase [Halodesulfurarchaeum formicicum]
MHVVFDMDGVLLDSQAELGWLDRALDETLQAFDIEPTPERRELLYPPNLRNFEQAAKDLGVPPAELWPVRHRHYVQEKERALKTGQIVPFPDIQQVHTLAQEHPVSIISNSPESIVETFVAVADLDAVVAHWIGRGDDLETIERMKPDPAFYEDLVDRAGPDEYVYVGDTSSDALFAQRTGMDFVHLDRSGGQVSSLAGAIELIRGGN